jgi:hypothetical protein
MVRSLVTFYFIGWFTFVWSYPIGIRKYVCRVDETGLWDVLAQTRKTGMKDCNIGISAVRIHCRQNVELRDNFEIRTHINGWDDNDFYFEIPNKRIYITRI